MDGCTDPHEILLAYEMSVSASTDKACSTSWCGPADKRCIFTQSGVGINLQRIERDCTLEATQRRSSDLTQGHHVVEKRQGGQGGQDSPTSRSSWCTPGLLTPHGLTDSPCQHSGCSPRDLLKDQQAFSGTLSVPSLTQCQVHLKVVSSEPQA